MQQKFQMRVISLRDQAQRRTRMAQELQDAWEWQFFDAIRGADLGLEAACYDRARRLQVFGYDLRVNEIACFLSHRAMWQEAVRLGQPMLILEDDVRLSLDAKSAEVGTLLNRLAEQLGDALFVRLGNSRIRTEKTCVLSMEAGFDIVRYHRDPLGAFAYLLSPKMAQRLVAHSEKFFTPVDDYMWRGWDHGCLLYDLTPDVFCTQEDGNPSTIGDRKKPAIGLKKKIMREWHRFFDNKEKMKYEISVLKQIKHRV